MKRTVLLASASTSRYRLLTDGGINPLVQVSAVDEEKIEKLQNWALSGRIRLASKLL